ncbi:nucleoside recognition domain-containing protein [Sporomusa sp.]|uniref:nucleoside recognition domain-containing protein n=1 Tax=Sporomusa sp. TaxID=2078658 RepID=UPI002C24D115|nr:nucleoside recognition domain-containing protein [Sporomusa sp.]HWR43703.1 nucleoside recognition domain-containing protein [Sporomusa sp.]
MAEENQEKYKVTWKGWLSLIILLISFSGIFAKIDSPLRALDFQVLTGDFGQVAKGVIFTGKGGTGARDGFMFALTLFPTLMFALGCIQVAESLGALRAAEVLFRPILQPFMGIPGASGLAFVSSITSSDVAAVMTKELVEDKLMTEEERAIFVAYQYAGSAPVTNTFGTGAALLPISVLPVGIIIGLIFIVKVMGANLVRLYLKWQASKNRVEGSGANG